MFYGIVGAENIPIQNADEFIYYSDLMNMSNGRQFRYFTEIS